MRRLRLIGIGAGDPAGLTLEAIEAIRATDVFVVLDKGESASDLAAARRGIIDRFAEPDHHRVVEVQDTVRDPALPYEEAVRDWHHRRVLEVEGVLERAVGEDESAAILVWGDPSIYDSTIRVVDEILARGEVPFDHVVVPGTSSLQLLCARHRITLNRIGRSVLMTTGRLLRDGVPDGVDDLVVLLDASNAFAALDGESWDIFWGAYLGSPDELLIAGALDAVRTTIVETRAAARSRKGWIFDLYLLRRREPPTA